MKTARWLPLLVVVLVAACRPWGASPSPAVPSPLTSPTVAPSPAGGPPKVTGMVTAAPVCPVEQSPPNPACAPRPVAGAVIVVTNLAGEELGRTMSAADGSYELVVGVTGMVRITALPVTGLMGQPPPVEVTLDTPTSVERVDLEYDTGIR